MRFFSNDAKETHDEETDRQDDVAAVPQQRTGSPWSDTRLDENDKSEVSDDEHVNPELLDGEPAEPTGVTDDHRTGDHETVDGEVVDGEPVAAGGHNAHDLGGPETATGEHDDLDLPLDEQAADSAGPRDEPFGSEPFVTESTVTTPGAPVTEPTDSEITGTDEDPAIRDEGDFDEPHAVDPATDKTLGTPAGTGTTDSDVDEPTATEVDAPVAVTPVAVTPVAVPVDEDGESTTYAGSTADEPVLADDTITSGTTTTEEVAAGQVPAGDTAVVATVPVAVAAGSTDDSAAAGSDTPAKPGTVEEKSVERFFDADAASTFHERWRDVQLRFVDSPKDAATEAAGLVDEAVDQLTASLKSQKDGLVSDSEDTEKLRIELRGYRDILNKVLSL